MELGISSLGNLVELALTKKYTRMIDLLLDATEACLKFAEEEKDVKVCEIVLDPPEIHENEYRQKFVDLCNSFSIKKSIHGPFIDITLCSHNAFLSKASVEAYIESAKICDEINAHLLTIHPGLPNYLSRFVKGFNVKRLIEATNALLDATSKLKTTVCIENMPSSTNFFLKVKEIDDFFTVMNRNDLFITYDTSHAWTCNMNLELFWEKFHDKIKNIHLVDNADKKSDNHPVLGSGKVNFQEIFDLARKYNYDGSMIIELSFAKGLAQSIDFIQKFLY